jgi:hypothetical protein
MTNPHFRRNLTSAGSFVVPDTLIDLLLNLNNLHFIVFTSSLLVRPALNHIPVTHTVITELNSRQWISNVVILPAVETSNLKYAIRKFH